MAVEVENNTENIRGFSDKLKNLKPVNGLTKKVVGDAFDEWKRLDGHSFTAGFLVESLRTNDEEYKRTYGNRPVKDIEAYDVSKGKGFCSSVLRCIVFFVDSASESDTYTTILKIPGTESFDQLSAEMDIAYTFNDENMKAFAFSHQTETDFYNHLASTLDIPYPKVFKTLPWAPGEYQGVLHMEDMTGKGTTTGFYPSVNIAQIKKVVKHLVHMHKVCLTSDENHQKLWKGKYNKNQLAFASLAITTAEYDGFLDICKDRGYFETILGKYKKFGGSPDYIEYACSTSWKDLNLEPVLVHGDLWGGNIMWKLDENNEVSNEIAAFMDWQIIHEGSPMADLARLLVNSADGAIRRQAEEFIVEFYHDLLEKEMKEAGKPCPYTVDQLKETYNYMYLTQVFGLVMFTTMCKEYFKADNPEFAEAKLDTMILRCKHGLEDMDRLLTGPMKHVFERFG